MPKISDPPPATCPTAHELTEAARAQLLDTITRALSHANAAAPGSFTWACALRAAAHMADAYRSEWGDGAEEESPDILRDLEGAIRQQLSTSPNVKVMAEAVAACSFGRGWISHNRKFRQFSFNSGEAPTGAEPSPILSASS